LAELIVHTIFIISLLYSSPSIDQPSKFS
jgi:hypothetical protein